MDFNKKIKYLIILDVCYIMIFVLSMLRLTPELEHLQRMILIFFLSSCIYFIIRISQSLWQSEFFMSSPFRYYFSRISLTLLIFFFHFTVMHTTLLVSANMMISDKLINTFSFPEERVTFYVYDNDEDNFKTSVAVRNTLLPLRRTIIYEQIVSQESLTITCSKGRFIITDGDSTFSYPCRYHARHGYNQ